MFLKQLPPSTPFHPRAPSMFLVMQQLEPLPRVDENIHCWNAQFTIWESDSGGSNPNISQIGHVHWNHHLDEYECRIQAWLVHVSIQVDYTSRQQNKSQTTICHTSQPWSIEMLKSVEAFIFGGLRHHDISKWQWSSFFSLALGIGWGEAGQHLHLTRQPLLPQKSRETNSMWFFSWNVCQVYDSLKSMGWIAPNAWRLIPWARVWIAPDVQNVHVQVSPMFPRLAKRGFAVADKTNKHVR